MNLIIKLQNYINNLKIRRKLVIIYLVTGLVPMLIIVSFLIQNTYKMIINQHNTQIVADNKRVSNIIFNIIYHCTNISNTLTFDENLRSLLSKEYLSDDEVYEAYRNYNLIDTFASNYTETSSIKIYVNNKTMVNNNRFIKNDSKTKESYWYKKAMSSSGEAIWISDSDSDSDRISYLKLIKKIPLPESNDSAILVISISNNYLKLMVDDTSLNTVLYLDRQSNFYSENENDFRTPFNLDLHDEDLWKDSAYKSKYEDKKVMMFDSIMKVLQGSNRIQIITIDKDALNDAKSAARIMALIALISISFPLFLIFFFTKKFSNRVITLRKEMRKIARGDLNIINNFSGTDELGELFTDMTITIRRLQSLNTEIYQEKLSQQKLKNHQQKIEFKMLANQINPHFLFNTLETINMKAISQKQEDIAQITVLLGKLLRRSLQTSDRAVTLKEEINYIQTYLNIQRYRFGDRIDYEIDIDSSISIDHYFILPLLLQPIIENAMIHGLEVIKTKGTIKISIMPHNPILTISICDNGIGMDFNKKQRLLLSLENIDAPQTQTSVGIRNVSNRIKLYYGEQYGIDIQSEPNVGTKVTISLPLDGKGVIEYETANC